MPEQRDLVDLLKALDACLEHADRIELPMIAVVISDAIEKVGREMSRLATVDESPKGDNWTSS